MNKKMVFALLSALLYVPCSLSAELHVEALGNNENEEKRYQEYLETVPQELQSYKRFSIVPLDKNNATEPLFNWKQCNQYRAKPNHHVIKCYEKNQTAFIGIAAYHTILDNNQQILIIDRIPAINFAAFRPLLEHALSTFDNPEQVSLRLNHCNYQRVIKRLEAKNYTLPITNKGTFCINKSHQPSDTGESWWHLTKSTSSIVSVNSKQRTLRWWTKTFLGIAAVAGVLGYLSQKYFSKPAAV